MNSLDEKLERIELLISRAAFRSLAGYYGESDATLEEAAQLLRGYVPDNAERFRRAAVLRQSVARMRIVGVGR